jgi:putative transcriptional regulator
MKSLAGKFLVASPHLEDPNFRRTIVYMIKHDEDEALGFIINRPTKLRIRELLEQDHQVPDERNFPIYSGGPVTGPLMALHDAFDLTDDFQSDLAVSIEKQTIVELLERSENQVRIFYGYSGWGPGQLEQELEMGGWLVAEATSDRVFAKQEDLWEAVIIEIGRDIMATGIDKGRIPIDPSFN